MRTNLLTHTLEQKIQNANELKDYHIQHSDGKSIFTIVYDSKIN